MTELSRVVVDRNGRLAVYDDDGIALVCPKCGRSSAIFLVANEARSMGVACYSPGCGWKDDGTGILPTILRRPTGLDLPRQCGRIPS